MDSTFIESLAEEFGTPLYIFESDAFIKNYNNMLESFRSIYPKYNIAYSYKTNYTPRVCQLVKKMGGLAEVVSDMEYALAKKIGYDDKDIIYNGPLKGPLMETHLLNGGIANIDNEYDAKQVIEIAQNHPETVISVGIRLNIDLGKDWTSRFGFEINSPELNRIISQFSKKSNVLLEGFHCHISRARGLEDWKKRIESMLHAVDYYFKDRPPRFINLGSGMYGEMDDDFASQFPGPIPSYQDYANTILPIIAEKYDHLDDDKMPFVYTEPGTTLIAKYFSVLSQVKTIKTIREKTFAVLDCSIYNLGSVALRKKLPISIFGFKEEMFSSIDLTGYTCLEEDVLFSAYSGAIGVGSLVLFMNTGGYSIVLKPPFINPNCPIIEILPNGQSRLIKRWETVSDVFSSFSFDDQLEGAW